MNAFDDLLASVTEENDRKALGELGTKYPEIKNSVLRQSDYSRKMDEVRDRVALAEAWQKWRDENWLDGAYGENAGATKREIEKDKRIKELEVLVDAGGEVTFEALNKHVEQLIADKKLVDKGSIDATLKEKEDLLTKQLQDSATGSLHMAMTLPKVAIKHFREFNEEIDTEALVKFANEKKIYDLNKAYDEQVASRRAEIKAKQDEEKLAAARAEGKAEGLKERAMSPERFPVDNGSPEMGHFQRKILNVKPEGENKGSAPDDTPLGKGIIAAHAARAMAQKDLERNA